MAAIEYSHHALDDITRLVDFLIGQDANAALATFDIIENGIMLLRLHPEIGRPVPDTEVRELVISRGNTGYVALYEFIEALDKVLILAIKHQREVGFD